MVARFESRLLLATELQPLGLDAVSCALRRVDGVKLDRNPRMADAARWVTAAEPALGWEGRAFVTAYFRNEAEGQDALLEASPVAQLIKQVAKQWFTGTNTERLERLNLMADDDERRSKSWPKNAHSLSGKLHRLAPTLRAKGVAIDFERQPGGVRRRLVILRTMAQPSVPSVPPPAGPGPDAAEGGTERDAAGTEPDPGVPGLVPPAEPAAQPHGAPFRDARDGRDAQPRPGSAPTDDAPAAVDELAPWRTYVPLSAENVDRYFALLYPGDHHEMPTARQKRQLVLDYLRGGWEPPEESP